MATQVTTSGEGAFTFVGKVYKISGDPDNVIFNIDDDGNVTGVEGLDGTIAADFENGIEINGNAVQVVGDKNNQVSVAASTSNGVSEISGVNGDSVSLSSIGGANQIITTSSGTFIIGEKTFVIDGDKNGVTFTLDNNGNITRITGLDGTITGDFSDGIMVNSHYVKVSGDEENPITVTATTSDGISEVTAANGGEVTISSVGGSNKFSTGSDGIFTFGKKTFEITESNGVTFELDDNGNVTGVTNLTGNIIIIGTNDAFNFNGNAIRIGANDTVTISADSDGTITEIIGLDTFAEGVPSTTTVTATEKNITVNGSAISVNEGTNTNYVLTLDENATPTQISGLSDGVTVNNAPNMKLVTEGNGTFRIGGRNYAITGEDDGVIFTTNESNSVVTIDEVDGAISFSGDATLSVNGYEVAIDKVISSGATISIYGGSEGIYNFYGLENGDSVNGDLNGAAISIPGSSSNVVVYINEREYKLSGDTDGAIIIPSDSLTSIKYLSADSTFWVDSAGTYKVTNDDDETVTLVLDGAGTIISDEDGVVYTYNSNYFSLDSTSDIDTILNTIAKQPSNYTNLKTPLTTFDADVNYNLNLTFYLNNKNSSPANYNFSSSTYRKRISLEGGDQNLTLNSAGDNIVVVTAAATGNKNISLGTAGDNVVIEETSAEVTISAGTGQDDIVSKSDIVVKTNDSGISKITPLNDATITLDSYGEEEYDNGTGVQTSLGKVIKAVKTNSISFGDGKASIRGEGTVIFNSDAESIGFTKANFYDMTAYDGENNSGSPTKVAFTHTAGGVIDVSRSSDNIVIKGNYSGDKSSDYEGSLFGGYGNDTIFAGAGDIINAGTGNNLIELSTNRSDDENSATIFITEKSSNNTIKSFKFGADSSADIIQTGKYNLNNVAIEDTDVIISLKNAGNLTLKDAVGKTVLLENDFVDTAVKFQFTDDSISVNDTDEYYWATGSDVTVEVSSNFSADAVNIDLTNSDIQDEENLRFNGDIKVLDAGNFEGNATLTGNDSANIITASKGNSTLTGGKGNDTLIGGKGADLFLFAAGHGNDVIQNFDFDKDKINTAALNLQSITTDEEGNASLKLSDGTIIIEEAVGNILQFENNYFSETATFQLGYDNLIIANEADYYWAGGNNATVSLAGYSAESVSIDLTGTDFEDTENLKIFGDAQNVDASNYSGTVNIIGSQKSNSITLGSGAALIKYSSGGGNDTVFGVKENDTLQIINANYSTVQSDDDLIVNVGSGSILLKDAANITLTIGGTIEGGASKTVVGTSGKDTITNTVAGAVITALGGNDSIYNIGNRVSIDAGTGNDTVENSGTNTYINGGSGDDIINNTALTVTIAGGSGYDTITNSGTNVSINAGDANDKISNSGSRVTIIGGKGADSIFNQGDNVSISGGDSRDSIVSDGSNVTITGGDGEDIISLSSSSKNVLIQYHSGDDIDNIYGISAGDTVKVTGAKYSSLKSGQNIKVNVGTGYLLLRNVVGVDFKLDGTLESADAANVLKGTAKQDTLTNAEDSFIIQGLGGADSIQNSGSSVTIIGGTGNDTITNTGNSNIYQYASGDGNDTIFGFTAYDTLQITKGTIKSSLATGSDFILYIGAGSVTFKGLEGDATVNVLDAKGVLSTVKVGKLVQGTAKADVLANLKDGYQIEGFAANDRITNYGNKVTIIGGTGNDTITNHGEKVVYNYATSDGKDIIYGFSSTDTLHLTKGKITGSVVSGSDFILNIGAGSVTFKNMDAGSYVNVINADGSKTVFTIPRLVQGTSRIDTLSNDKDRYLIDALGGADKITNSGSNCTIIGGNGNDTITNTGGKNLYQYATANGKDTIIGFAANDTLQITKGTIKSSVVSGNDFILNIGAGSVTFKNMTGGTAINLIDSSGKSSTLTVPKIMQGTAKSDTLTNTEKDYEIEAFAGNDYISNSGSNVTIIGGKGNDTINNSGSKNLYKYAAGDGKDTIIGFAANDTLQITKGTIKNSVVSDNDFILGVGTSSITVKDVVGQTITLIDAKGNSSSFKVPYIHTLTAKSDSFTNEDAGYEVHALAGNDSIENFAKNVTVYAGEGKDYVYNIGSNSVIDGGAGNDAIDNFSDNCTIIGGKGNDTITNNGTKNVYQYASGDGKDTIVGFSTTDTLEITYGNLKTTSVNGMDVIINVGSGSITLEDAAGKNINIKNSAGTVTTTLYSGIWEGTAKADTYSNSTSNLILRGQGGNDTIENYAANVAIYGGAGHDSISVDKSKNVTVIGGAGNDTISNSGGAVRYQYASGDGKDVIVGFTKNDTLQITGGTVKSVTKTGGNTIISVGSGSITLQKYTGNVNLVDRKDATINVNAWFAEDNNFITEDTTLDSVMEDKFAVTNFETENYSSLAQESTLLTFSKDK